MIEGLSTILKSYQRGTSAEADRIFIALQWWGVYDLFDAELQHLLGEREKVLRLAAVLPISPDCIAACDRMAATLEELIGLLAVALTMPTPAVGVIALPGDLTKGGGDD